VEGLAPVLARLGALDPPVDASLTIIGDGDARAALEAELDRHGVADRVNFTGWVPIERVPELLGAADVCVDPAPATEVNERSTMIKIAEYLALGKPVVAYDLLETRRTAAGAALLIPPGDAEGFAQAIAQLARDPELRLRLSRGARERAEELTWEHSERALLGAYAALSARRA
jgi:glycosyltransferase involved in cell wall biosynthesis